MADVGSAQNYRLLFRRRTTKIGKPFSVFDVSWNGMT
jgi:hypothetical protein